MEIRVKKINGHMMDEGGQPWPFPSELLAKIPEGETVTLKMPDPLKIKDIKPGSFFHKGENENTSGWTFTDPPKE